MSETVNLDMLVVTGPTASGKTGKAVGLARAFDGEIISADSRQVYRGMDIGSGKDIEEYGEVPYHLIDIAEPGEVYNLYRFLKDARHACDGIKKRNRLPIVCGGTGLYVESLLRGVDLPEVPANLKLRESLKGKSLDELTDILASMKTMHNTTDADTAARAIRAIEIQQFYIDNPELAAPAMNPQPVTNAIIIATDIDRDSRRRRISQRLHKRLDEGMVDEVKKLIDNGVDTQQLINYGLEYKFLTLYITGVISYDRMKTDLETAIHQFAKRQMTWFRGMERRGFHINWLRYDMPDDEFSEAVSAIIKQQT